MVGLGLAIGVFVGNSVKRGTIAKQVRQAGRILFKRAQSIEHDLSSWLD